MTPAEIPPPETFGPDDVLAHARAAAGYDRDLGGLTDALTLTTGVAALLDFGLVCLFSAPLILAVEGLHRLPLGHGLFSRFVESMGEHYAFLILGPLALYLSALLGSLVANPDARLRAAGAPGARLPARPFGLFTGLVARARVLRRMRLQRGEPLNPEDPALFDPFARERSAPLRAWAREALAAETGDAEEVEAALARLDAPPEPGESRAAALARSLAALRTALVARAAARDAAALASPWPERGQLEEPIRLGGARP